jgi:uncharacterized protein DUF6174
MRIPFYLSLFALTLCAGLPRADGFSDLLAANKAKWQARQPEHYTYRYSSSCYCQPLTWQVEVENGAVKEIKQVYSTPVPGTIPDDLGIDSVFEWIRKTKAGNPDELKVTYDAEFGFPSAIFVDHRKTVADDEKSVSIDSFKAIPKGVTLSRDTVFTWNWPGVVDSLNSVRITNTGDTPLYLNKIGMSLSPTDTFPGMGGAALRFYNNLPGNVGNSGRTFLRNGGLSGTDSIAVLSNALMPPGGSLLLFDFNFDPCFCLLKTGTKIADGDPLTLLLRLDFSRGVQADRVDVRAYVRVRSRYGYTSGIVRPGVRGEGGNGRPGHVTGRFPAGDRVFAADGRNLAPFHPSPSP